MEKQEIEMISSSENSTEPSNVNNPTKCDAIINAEINNIVVSNNEKEIQNDDNLNIKSAQVIEISEEKNLEHKLAESNLSSYLASKIVDTELIKSDLNEINSELETKSATKFIEENLNSEIENHNLNSEVKSKSNVQIDSEVQLLETSIQLKSNSHVSIECSLKPENLINSEQNIKLMESSTIISSGTENKLELIAEENSGINTVKEIESEGKTVGAVIKGQINLQINQPVDYTNILVSDSEEYLTPPEYGEIRSHNKSTDDILECDITAQSEIDDLVEFNPKKNYESLNEDDSDEDEDEGDHSSEIYDEEEEDNDEEDEDPENNSEDDDEDDEEELSPKKSKYEDNNDEVMILDSSDEEEAQSFAPPLSRSRPGPAFTKTSQKKEYYDEESEDSEADESDEEESSSENYDDNDLMDMAVLASAGPSTSSQLEKRKPIKNNKNFDDVLKNIQNCSKGIKRRPNKTQIRRKLKRRIDQINFRCIMKKFSIKCLNSRRMHNVGEVDFHQPSTSTYHNRENHQMSLDENSFYDSPVNSEFLTSERKKNDVNEIESSSDKNQPSKSDKMQPVEKIRESIQKSEDLKEQENIKSSDIDDEQNKENLENNEKIISNILNDKSEEIKCQKIEEPEKEKKNEKETEEESFKSEDDSTLVAIETEESTQKMEITEDKSIKIQEILNTDNKLITDDCSGDINKTSKVSHENFVISEVKSIGPAELSRKRSRSEENDNIKSCGTGITSTSTPIQQKIPKPSIDINSPVVATAVEEIEEDIHPTKKLRAELEINFRTHDRILSEYMERTSNETPEHIDKHISQLALEIQTLNDMIKDKEIEWNKLLNLKKCKEEICYRLTRKKQTLEIMNTKVGEIPPLEQTTPPDVSKLANMKIPQIDQINSSLVAAMTAATGNSPSNVFNLNLNGNSTAQNILQTRANMKSSDLAKEKANTQKLHRLLVSRNILPKPSGIVSPPSTQPQQESSSVGLFGSSSTLNNLLGNNSAKQQPILNNYLTTAASVQQQLGELLNGHHNHQQNGPQNLMIGRQGVFKDVKAIIAEYRQKNADPPRRGRRLKSTNNNEIIGGSLSNNSSGLGPIRNSNSEFNQLSHKYETNSRPSSNDSSSHSLNLNGSGANLSFKDVLVQFAKMSGQNPERLAAVAAAVSASQQNGKQTNHSNFTQPPYPEVTLHPVSTTQSSESNGSLLHGILTKFTRPTNCSLSQAITTASTPTTSCAPSSTTTNFNSTFSPTLARLLTGEQRISSGNLTPTVNTGSLLNNSAAGGSSSSNASGLNLSKVVGHNSEITITPVSTTLHQSLLQHQLQHQNQLKEVLSRQASIGTTNIGASVNERLKTENFMNIDDEADDSVDRLVIDEGNDDQPQHQIRIAPNAIGQEFHENEVPVCQGCKRHEAQFVCAGCGNQWYCSRECQVNAWDDHSEVCTG